MATAEKFTKHSISHGQIFLAGEEKPDHVGKTKSKLQRKRRTAPEPTNQSDRAGMSGSGLPQAEDIVTGDTGQLTQPTDEGEKDAAKQAEKNQKEIDKDVAERQKEAAKARKQ